MDQINQFTVRRRQGDLFDGRQNQSPRDALEMLRIWMIADDSRPDNTILQLVDETTNAAVLTLRYSAKDEDWKIQR